MRRVLNLLFLLFFFFFQLTPLYAQSPVPTIIPGVDGVLIPGVTCGVAGDADIGKTKCCVPKRADNGVWSTISSVGSNVPIIGDFLDGIVDKVESVTAIQNSMSPCVGDPNSIVPSTPNELTNKACICIEKDPSSKAIVQLTEFCKKYFPLGSQNNEILKCSQCMMNVNGGFYTAIGCIPLDIGVFISNYILGTGIGIAGGVALLCILYSAFRMQTSMGNAEALKKAQENLTACITGLIVIIFSVLILKIIGVDILRIPGLFKP